MADDRADGAAARPQPRRRRRCAETLIPVASLQLLYLSPYLTCAECNAIAFIDSAVLQRALRSTTGDDTASVPAIARTIDGDNGRDAGASEHSLALEALPKCPACGRTHGWVVGARDLTSQIAGNAEQRARQKALRLQCATRIQAAARGALGRAYAARVRAAKEARDRLRFASATAIAALYRGRLDRRAATVQRSLRRIERAHRMVLREALRPRKGRKVRWYKRKEELRLLFRDYRLLVRRTGNVPPLHQVEADLLEIGRRVNEIESRYATRIQRRARGNIGRAFIRTYRAERAFVMQQRAAAALPLQRCLRAWHARLRVRERRELRARRALAASASAEMQQRRRWREADAIAVELRAAYAQELAAARAAKLLRGEQWRHAPRTAASAAQLVGWLRARDAEARVEAQGAASRLAAMNQRGGGGGPQMRAYFAEETAVCEARKRAARAAATGCGGATPASGGSAFVRELQRFKRLRQRRPGQRLPALALRGAADAASA